MGCIGGASTLTCCYPNSDLLLLVFGGDPPIQYMLDLLNLQPGGEMMIYYPQAVQDQVLLAGGIQTEASIFISQVQAAINNFLTQGGVLPEPPDQYTPVTRQEQAPPSAPASNPSPPPNCSLFPSLDHRPSLRRGATGSGRETHLLSTRPSMRG